LVPHIRPHPLSHDLGIAAGQPDRPAATRRLSQLLAHEKTNCHFQGHHAWPIEDDNKAGKDLVGMDQYQVRNWTPWYRHITVCMLAQAFLAVTRGNLGKDRRRSSGAAPGPPS
jgi:hypothetical protein